jgi:serine/threonine protein kinase
MMKFSCSFCRAILEVDNNEFGISVQCASCGEVINAPISRVTTNVVLGNDFLILEEIGAGGMGVVYLSHQISLDRPAALKVLTEKYTQNNEFISNFIKEARSAAKLNHPNIVQAYAVGEDSGIYYFAMEYIEGETMKNILKRLGKIPIEQAVEVIRQISDSLDFAWKEQRLIHRDIKPDNIMIVTRTGRAKLADLGLARVAGEVDNPNQDEVMGTPQYISPEHLMGAPMDLRSDIYSLGATFYHLLTGVFPFTGKSTLEIAKKHIEETLKSPKLVCPEIPDSLAKIIMKMMEKSPEDRYQTNEALIEDIKLFRGGDKRGKRMILHTGQFKIPQISTHSQPINISSSKIATGRISTTGLSLGTGSGAISTASIKKMKEKQAVRQIITLLSICAFVVFGSVAFLIYNNIQKSKEKEKAQQEAIEKQKKTLVLKKKPAQDVPDGKTPSIPPVSEPPLPVEPQNTNYTELVAKILDFAKHNSNANSDILAKCDAFLASNSSPPVYKCEKDAFAALLAVFVPLDEKYRLAELRQIARNSHLFLIQKRIDEEARLQSALQEKERAKEREEQLKQMGKEKEEQKKKEIENYAKDLEKRKDDLRYMALLTISDRKNYQAAKEVFDSAEKEPETVQSHFKEDAKNFALWATEMKGLLENTKTFQEQLANLKNESIPIIKIEVKPGTFGKFKKIKDNLVSIETDSGKIQSNSIFDIPIPQYKKLMQKLANDPQQPYLFLLFNGKFNGIDQLLADEKLKKEESAKLKIEGNAFIKAYIKGKYNYISTEMAGDAKEKALKDLKTQFGMLPQFKEAVAELNK